MDPTFKPHAEFPQTLSISSSTLVTGLIDGQSVNMALSLLSAYVWDQAPTGDAAFATVGSFNELVERLDAWEEEVITVTWDNLENKPVSFPPSSHTHASAEITDASAVGGAANANKLVLYGANGGLSAVVASGAGLYANYTGGSTAVNSHAVFGLNQMRIRASDSALVYSLGSYTAALAPPLSASANVTLRWPATSGTLAVAGDVVSKTASESINGIKTFTSAPISTGALQGLPTELLNREQNDLRYAFKGEVGTSSLIRSSAPVDEQAIKILLDIDPIVPEETQVWLRLFYTDYAPPDEFSPPYIQVNLTLSPGDSPDDNYVAQQLAAQLQIELLAGGGGIFGEPVVAGRNLILPWSFGKPAGLSMTASNGATSVPSTLAGANATQATLGQGALDTVSGHEWVLVNAYPLTWKRRSYLPGAGLTVTGNTISVSDVGAPNCVTLNLTGDQAVGGTKTFSISPRSTGTADAATSLITRDQGDGRYITLSGNQSVAGLKTFSTSPQSSGAATAANSLITRAQGDARYVQSASLAGGSFDLFSLNQSNVWTGVSQGKRIPIEHPADVTAAGVFPSSFRSLTLFALKPAFATGGFFLVYLLDEIINNTGGGGSGFWTPVLSDTQGNSSLPGIAILNESPDQAITLGAQGHDLQIKCMLLNTYPSAEVYLAPYGMAVIRFVSVGVVSISGDLYVTDTGETSS
jgi:hypothetical protein